MMRSSGKAVASPLKTSVGGWLSSRTTIVYLNPATDANLKVARKTSRRARFTRRRLVEMTKRNVTRDPGVLAALRSVGGANALARKLGDCRQLRPEYTSTARRSSRRFTKRGNNGQL